MAQACPPPPTAFAKATADAPKLARDHDSLRSRSLVLGTVRKSPPPVPGATIVADTVASDALRARNGLSIVSGAQGQIGQLIERHDAFLTLALQQTTNF